MSDEMLAAESGFQQAAAKVKLFPQRPGVYLIKDAAGRVIYIGKAKNLRSRAGSYFLKGLRRNCEPIGSPRSPTSTSSNAKARWTRC
jgi:excinuclease ABC subunit C